MILGLMKMIGKLKSLISNQLDGVRVLEILILEFRISFLEKLIMIQNLNLQKEIVMTTNGAIETRAHLNWEVVLWMWYFMKTMIKRLEVIYWNHNWLLNDVLFMTNVKLSLITVILEHIILVHNCNVQLTHIDKDYITLK